MDARLRVVGVGGRTIGNRTLGDILRARAIWATRLPGIRPDTRQSMTVVRATPSLSANACTPPAFAIRP